MYCADQLKIALWATKGLLKTINQKNILFKILQRQPNNTELKTSKKKYRNNLNFIIKKNKYEYYKAEIDNNAYNSKKLFIDKIDNKKKK